MNRNVAIFDPPMCCATGVCGPAPDPKLLAIKEAILELQAHGVTVDRYMLTAHSAAFMQQPEVAALLQTPAGVQELPVTLVNGVVLKKGGYPTLAELQAALG